MRTSTAGYLPAKYFSVSGRHSPRSPMSATGGIGFSELTDNHSASWLLAFPSARALVSWDGNASCQLRQSSQRGSSRAHRSRGPRLAFFRRVLTIRPRPQPTGTAGATLRVASLASRTDPCLCHSPMRSAAAPRRSPPLPSERNTTCEKRNADQRLAAGRMPDCDC